jgi:hypothetical protein
MNKFPLMTFISSLMFYSSLVLPGRPLPIRISLRHGVPALPFFAFAPLFERATMR